MGLFFSCKVLVGCKIECCAVVSKTGPGENPGYQSKLEYEFFMSFLHFFVLGTLLGSLRLVLWYPEIWIILITEYKLVSRVIVPYYFLARSMTDYQLSACHGQNKIWPDYRYHTCETCCVLRLAISLVWHHLLTLKWRWIQEPPVYDSYQQDLLIWKTIKGIISGPKYNFNTYSASFDTYKFHMCVFHQQKIPRSLMKLQAWTTYRFGIPILVWSALASSI